MILAGCSLTVDELRAKQKKAQDIFSGYLEEDKEYVNALSQATSSKKSVEIQFKMVNQLLEELF